MKTISDKVEFRTRNFIKRRPFYNDKVNLTEDIKILNVFSPNNKASRYIN